MRRVSVGAPAPGAFYKCWINISLFSPAEPSTASVKINLVNGIHSFVYSACCCHHQSHSPARSSISTIQGKGVRKYLYTSASQLQMEDGAKHIILRVESTESCWWHNILDMGDSRVVKSHNKFMLASYIMKQIAKFLALLHHNASLHHHLVISLPHIYLKMLWWMLVTS